MRYSFTKKLIVAAGVSLVLAPSAMAQSNDWVRQAARQIATKQTYPHVAQMRGEEGTAKVKIFVGVDGSVQRTELVAPSGSSTLDREALALPARAGTLPAPPGGATAVTLPITWKLL